VHFAGQSAESDLDLIDAIASGPQADFIAPNVILAGFTGFFWRSGVAREALAVVMRGAEMYAVIKTGGKQYRVAAGEKIKIEQIPADVGQEVRLDQVLAIGNGADLSVGTPLVAGANVLAKVIAQGRHDKVRIFKMRRRKHYQKHQGHRQAFTELEISAVNA
jgi:large subunit ribosomal protein L21